MISPFIAFHIASHVPNTDNLSGTSTARPTSFLTCVRGFNSSTVLVVRPLGFAYSSSTGRFLPLIVNGYGLHYMYRRTFYFRHSCFILSQYINLVVVLPFSQYYRQAELHERDPSKGRKATDIDLLILSLESQRAPLPAEASQ